jgi:hypothetical protein
MPTRYELEAEIRDLKKDLNDWRERAKKVSAEGMITWSMFVWAGVLLLVIGFVLGHFLWP